MTDTLDTRSLESTVDKYLAAWTEVDSGKRAAMVSDVWADNGRLVDPPLTATGHDGISEMAATMQSQFPAHPMAERVVPEFRRSATG